MITFPTLLLAVGIMCLVLAGRALIQAEVHDGLFGLGLGIFLLLCWRWALGQSQAGLHSAAKAANSEPRYRALSVSDQFRVFRLLTRGEAPDDPKLAAITLDAAERYQTRSRVLSALFGLLPIALAFSLIVPSVHGALDGRGEMVILVLLGALGIVGSLMFNPWTRPTNVARSLKASREVVAASHEADGNTHADLRVP